MRAVLTGFVAAVGATLAAQAPAQAAWSPARTFDAPRHDGGELAVNGRGDAIVLWTSRSPARLHVTLLPAHGRAVTRVLSRRAARFTTVVLDERGGGTVAWTVDDRLYAAHGSVSGRWSAPQLIAPRDAFGPALAVSPDRRVLLAWTNTSATGPGSTGVAWRIPPHRFIRRTSLRRPAPRLVPGEAPQSDVGATFDARGRAYVWGSCDGVIRVARPRSRRLDRVEVAPGPVLGLSLSATGGGSGLASWVDSRCTSDPAAGSEPGPVLVRALGSGTFGPPVTLTIGPMQSTALVAWSTQVIALAGDGSLVTAWATTPSSPQQVAVSLDAQGRLSAVTALTDGRVPRAADAGGNLILSAPYVGFAVRPRSGGPDEPFDKGGSGPDAAAIGASAAVAANGRGFGALWDPDLTFGPDHRAVTPAKRLSVSRWTP
jgi:hypothetical protein